MKIVSTADLHARNLAKFATFKKGVSSRLLDLLQVIQEITEYCKENDVEVAVIIGDIFDERGVLKVPVFNAVHRALRELAQAVNRLYIVVGNHDMADKEGLEHSIYAFSDFAYVMDTCTKVIYEAKDNKDDVILGFLPYREEYTKEELKAITNKGDGPSILFGHVGVVGARGDNGYKFQHGHTTKSLKMNTWDKVFLGHYHTFQKMENVTYVGSPLQHDFADVGVKKSFTVYDTQTGKAKRVLTHAPTFEEVIVSEPSQIDAIANFAGKNVFVKVTVTDRKINVAKRLKEIEYEGKVTVVIKEEKARSERIKIDSTTSKDTMIKRYVKASDIKLNKSRLTELGLELMEGIGE